MAYLLKNASADWDLVRDPTTGQVIGTKSFDPNRGVSSSMFGGGSMESYLSRQFEIQKEREELARLKTAEEKRMIPLQSESKKIALESERLNLQGLQNQMSFMPQMNAIRGGIMNRMAGQLGLSQAGGMGGGFGSGFPQMGTMGGAGGPQPAQSFQGGMSRSGFGSLGMQSYGSSSMGGSSLTPSWMQSYQSPQFPRY